MTKESPMPDEPKEPEPQNFADALASFRAAFPADRSRGPSAADLEAAFDREFNKEKR